MRLHGAGCNCAQCAPQRVETSAAPVDLQVGARKATGAIDSKKLTPEQQTQIQKLQVRDREVRQHEQAHMAAAAGIAISAPSFSYQRGADGVNYAIGGEVGIDVSPGFSPQDTINKADRIVHAALAPKDPSGADHAVAAGAQQMAQSAQNELAIERTNSNNGGAIQPSHQNPASKAEQQINASYGAGDAPAISLIKAYA